MRTTKLSQVNVKQAITMRTLSLVCLGAALGTVTALAQVSAEKTSPSIDAIDESSTSLVAYVYVGAGDIYAYSAASNGKLTKIAGSPFPASVAYLAGTSKFLFGSTESATDIETYAIESNGSLHYVASANVVAPDGGNGEAGEIFTDHTGESLYDMAYFGNQGANNTFEELSINQSTGKLAYLGIAGDDDQINGRLSFTANDEFAYSADCYKTFASIYGFKRSSNGKLTQLNINPALPAASGDDWYCPWLAVSDTSSHVAVSMGALDPDLNSVGPNVLATYTVSSSGNLTTSSTMKNMPAVSVGEDINAMNTSPSGKLLAVAGNKGLQVFHFNGANPITHFTGTLTTSEVDQIFWDNANHLYAIGRSSNKLWVFTVTPTGYSQAPGSPYSINEPQGLRVMPL